MSRYDEDAGRKRHSHWTYIVLPHNSSEMSSRETPIASVDDNGIFALDVRDVSVQR